MRGTCIRNALAIVASHFLVLFFPPGLRLKARVCHLHHLEAATVALDAAHHKRRHVPPPSSAAASPPIFAHPRHLQQQQHSLPPIPPDSFLIRTDISSVPTRPTSATHEDAQIQALSSQSNINKSGSNIPNPPLDNVPSILGAESSSTSSTPSSSTETHHPPDAARQNSKRRRLTAPANSSSTSLVSSMAASSSAPSEPADLEAVAECNGLGSKCPAHHNFSVSTIQPFEGYLHALQTRFDRLVVDQLLRDGTFDCVRKSLPVWDVPFRALRNCLVLRVSFDHARRWRGIQT